MVAVATGQGDSTLMRHASVAVLLCVSGWGSSQQMMMIVVDDDVDVNDCCCS